MSRLSAVKMVLEHVLKLHERLGIGHAARTRCSVLQ